MTRRYKPRKTMIRKHRRQMGSAAGPAMAGPGAGFPVNENCDWTSMWKSSKDKLGKRTVGSRSTYTATCMVDRQDQCEYVMKVQPIDPYFRNEVEALVYLKDTGVVAEIKEAWTCDGMGFIVMERLMECNVNVKNTDEVQLYSKKILDALRVIGENGWIHNDIHAGNIMCKKDMSLALIDFGLAFRRTENLKLSEHFEADRLSKYQTSTGLPWPPE